MKFSLRGILAAVVAAANIFSIQAQDSSIQLHNIATYNVRYTNAQTDGVLSDTGEKDWRERGAYVMQTIKDYDFDIVGMQEVTGLNCKYGKTYNLSQLNSLKEGLEDYSFFAYERDGSNDYSYNVIAYKTDKYESLDNGCFWLSATPDVASSGWDPDYASIKRTCGWSKMKVKATGEIFYFAVTHCNYGPSLDGPNGAKVIVERLSAMAGDYPVVLVGDFNMRRADHPKAYREYVTYFNDAALTAVQSTCMPEDNGQIPWTTTEWTVANKATSGSEFDFVFYRNMKAYNRYVITENYGRSVNPSDHYPVMVQFTLGTTAQAKKTLHVDATAATSGDGSIAAPYKTISEALNNAFAGDEILVTADTYKEQLTLNSSVVLKGGYDSTFTTVTGKTILDGDVNGDDEGGNTGDNLCNLVKAQYSSLEMSNFVICNAVSSARANDGALSIAGANLLLENIDFENCQATTAGAGILANCGDIVLRNCNFKGNTAAEQGGAAVMAALYGISIDNTVFDGNTASMGSALTLLGATTIKITNNTFMNNESKKQGTVYVPLLTADVTYGTTTFTSGEVIENCTFVNNTFANNLMETPSGMANLTKKYGGAAIYAQFSSTTPLFNLAHNTIVGNTSNFSGSNNANYGGSAVRVYGGKVTLMSNIIAGNFSEGAYADIYVDETSTLAKDRYNLVSAASTVNVTLDGTDFAAESYDACMTALPSTLDGTASDGIFTANVKNNGGVTPTVKVISTTYAGASIDVIGEMSRYVETSCSIDLDGDGKASGVLNVDQRGEARNTKSVPGACEYVDPSGIENIATSAQSLVVTPQGGKQVKISANDALGVVRVYSIAGIEVFAAQVNDTECVLDLGGCASGVYVVSAGGKNAKMVLKD